MREIIDSHTHIGTYDSWECPIDTLRDLMNLHGISYAITADLSGNSEGARSTQNAIEQVKRFGNAFRVLIWINPACDDDLDAAKEALTKYGSLAAGLKTHPRTAPIWSCAGNTAFRLSLTRKETHSRISGIWQIGNPVSGY